MLLASLRVKRGKEVCGGAECPYSILWRMLDQIHWYMLPLYFGYMNTLQMQHINYLGQVYSHLELVAWHKAAGESRYIWLQMPWLFFVVCFV